MFSGNRLKCLVLPIHLCCGGVVVQWLAHWTPDLEVGGLSLVSAVMLFP